uniref:Uncharacterized protein n=1 Tax=Arundo donax TaxID=35708 RepID=A0A0A8XNT6_ARUDO
MRARMISQYKLVSYLVTPLFSLFLGTRATKPR